MSSRSCQRDCPSDFVRRGRRPGLLFVEGAAPRARSGRYDSFSGHTEKPSFGKAYNRTLLLSSFTDTLVFIEEGNQAMVTAGTEPDKAVLRKAMSAGRAYSAWGREIFCVVAVLLAAGGYSAAAATLAVPGDYATIQDAINAASAGDTIVIAAGTRAVGGVINVNKAVTIQGAGKGGRNQEFCLAAALDMEDLPRESLVILSGGTDGNDGPTDAAGALVDPETVERGRKAGLDARAYLNDNDA